MYQPLRTYYQYLTGVILFLTLAFLAATTAKAQTLPPLQPEQDACSALQICGNFSIPYSYTGEGNKIDLSTTPCNSPEKNSVWFRLDVTASGILVFKIVPFDPLDDYDFAVVDITKGDCSKIQQSEVIRCNFNNNNQPNNYYPDGIVGLEVGAAPTSVAGGVSGQPFLKEINANAGDVYLIMINNFGHDNCTGNCPGAGFTLDFTGSTAQFNQPPPPAFASLQQSCDNSQSITIELSDNTLCSSIAPDGSDFYLTPQGTIQSAQGVGCSGTQGYTKRVTLTFSGQLPDGDYIVHAQTGTDNNTLLGICGAELKLPDRLNFRVSHEPIQMLSIDSPACQELIVQLNSAVKCSTIATDGSDFDVSGPAAVSVDAASGVGCSSSGYTKTVTVHLSQPIAVDGLYYLTARLGNDGNILEDTCDRSVAFGARLPFWIHSYNNQLTAHPDTNVCPGWVQLYVTNSATPPSGGFQYTWLPNTGLSGASPSVLIGVGYHRFIAETIDANGCYLRDSVVVKGYQSPVADFDYSIGAGCSGDTVFFHNKSQYANRYLWRLGEYDLTDTNKDAQHDYQQAGVYFVTLIANNGYCTDSAIHIISTGHPLIADFSVSDDTICQGEQVNFKNLSTITALRHAGFGYYWDFGDGTATNDENPSHLFHRSGVYPVMLVVNDSIPCYDTAFHTITVDSISGLDVTLSDTPICTGDKVIFNAHYWDGGLSYSRWNFGDTPDSVLGERQVSHAYDQAGTFLVSVYNHYRACPDTTLLFPVTIHETPVIHLGADTSLCLGGAPLTLKDNINEGNPAAHWLWNTGDTTSELTVRHPGDYRAEVTIHHCTASDNVTVTKDCYLDIPNSFTPNGDGHNDYFFPRQHLSAGLTVFHMSIYNRWGQKIFETANANGRGWDGKFNGQPQPMGVYVYMIEAAYKNGRTESYQGNVTLIR